MITLKRIGLQVIIAGGPLELRLQGGPSDAKPRDDSDYDLLPGALAQADHSPDRGDPVLQNSLAEDLPRSSQGDRAPGLLPLPRAQPGRHFDAAGR